MDRLAAPTARVGAAAAAVRRSGGLCRAHVRLRAGQYVARVTISDLCAPIGRRRRNRLANRVINHCAAAAAANRVGDEERRRRRCP